jgi:hypothetical protein
MERFYQVVLILATVVSSWLAMMVAHELGHVIHALISGGVVIKVVLCPWEFSRTDVSPNPAPLFVAWGGAIWGVLLPMLLWLAARLAVASFSYLTAFFAGFCCVANGAYIGVGSVGGAGDAGDLLRHGAAHWHLLLYGVTAVALGLWIWNGLGPRFGLGVSEGRVDRRASVAMAIAVAAILIGEIAWMAFQAW